MTLKDFFRELNSILNEKLQSANFNKNVLNLIPKSKLSLSKLSGFIDRFQEIENN